MIKLIASDMDGTFLDGNECVPEGSYDLVMRLRDAGIQFVASSGRRFDTLHELFEPVVDCMDFVASNGAQVMSPASWSIGGVLACGREAVGPCR